MFALSYAIKSIARRKKKNVITSIAIALGVALFIGAQSANDGIITTVAQVNLDFIGDTDIEITNPAFGDGYFPQNVENLIATSTDPRLKENIEEIAPIIQLTTSVYNKGLIESDVTFYGIQPQIEGFGNFIDMKGEVIKITEILIANNTIVSQSLADSLSLTIGDNIAFSLATGSGNYSVLDLTVSSIFSQTEGRGKVGYQGFFDNSQFYVNLNTVQDQLLPELAQSVNKILIKIAGVDRSLDSFDADGKTFPGKDKIIDAMEALEGVFINAGGIDDFNSEPLIRSSRVSIVETVVENLSALSQVLDLFAFILNATALLLIVNVQIMSVEDRKNQTAILRALGTSIGTIFTVFVLEATIVGIVGAIIGFGLGYLVSLWMLGLLSDVFRVELEASSIDPGLVIIAMIIGVVLSVLTAVIPSIKSAKMNVANALRGIDEEQKPRRGFLTLLTGVAFSVFGLIRVTNIGQFWKQEAWNTFEKQSVIMSGLGLTLAGIGMLLTLVMSRKLALSISGLSLWGMGNFVMVIAGKWAKSGDASNWFTFILFFTVTGSTILIAVNFDSLMKALTKVLFLFVGLRAIGQVTTRQMIGTKSRGILVFTILTIILILTIFVTSAAETQREGAVRAFDQKSKGVDIVVAVDVPVPGIIDRIENLGPRLSTLGYDDVGEIDQVFGFRRVFVPMYLRSPVESDFDVSRDLIFVPIIEVPESVINPDKISDDWGKRSLPLEFSFVSGNIVADTGNPTVKTTAAEHVKFSKNIFGKFFNANDSTRQKEVVINNQKTVETQIMVIASTNMDIVIAGDHSASLEEFDFYIQGNEGDPIPMYFGASASFDMMGVADLLGYGVLVTESIANQIPQFQDLVNPNLFLVRTTNGYGSKLNEGLADAIEIDLNDLEDVNSYSNQFGTLIGASTTIVFDIVESFWAQEAGFWDFLGAFSTLGLVIGGLGMMIIAVRSVNERTREIGMMRSIGFSRNSVVVGVLIELVALSLIGLFVGILTAITFTESFANNFLGIPANYPTFEISLYVIGVISIALISGVIPGYNASKVAPSQALRYTG